MDECTELTKQVSINLAGKYGGESFIESCKKWGIAYTGKGEKIYKAGMIVGAQLAFQTTLEIGRQDVEEGDTRDDVREGQGRIGGMR